MPLQSNDRSRQDTEGSWRGRALADHFPAQPPHRDHRTGGLSWQALNELPAGTSTRPHLNPH
ncbi:DNA repair protein [Micromonospora endophytica]|uniref:DNA repair protein n=1 Tax=Micromonospora endophytica TaxID=515350 RepID=A0A2W2CVR6_9ACTN|nr:DNA repair protein [Micromonospora endophytica]PZF92459.1 DNA repair protein [Micromonospora endophytica]RIW44049.1 DNA repair protein [Micromonospora endophytica]